MNKIMNWRNVMIISLLCVTCIIRLDAQNKTVNFRNLSWEEAMKTAEKEKKFIFVDAYRDNCDYCDEAIAKVFSRDSIADLYNENFVNIRINMNSEAGQAFAPKLQMLMYPAYIYFSADGEQLGSSNSWNFLKDFGQAMYQANSAITQGNIRLSNSRHILFEEELSWQAILEKSKKENKPIFVDAYTTWCRPCIQMDRNVFTLNEVADFYNENFINVKMNAEKGEGNDIREKFNIRAYPTYLYLDGNGELVSTVSGYTEAEKFIGYGEEAKQKYIDKNAEGKGIKFEKGTWEEVLGKAKAENKLIFFDGYTTWCGPCKMMAKNVFTNDTIANFFNEHFVNAKFDMEKGEGIELKDKFTIKAYPTYVYVDAGGNMVHRTVGSTTVQKFFQYAQDALSDDKNLSFLEEQYNNGNREPAFTENYLTALKVAYMSDEMGEVAAEYLDGLKGKQLLEEKNWEMLKEYLIDANSKSFAYLVKKRDNFYKLYDQKEVDDKIYNTYLRGAHTYVIQNEDKSIKFDEAGFQKYLESIEKSGVKRKDQIITYATINNLASREEWDKYAEEIDKGLENGNVDKSPMILYNYALTIKRVGETPELLSKGADWAKLGGDMEDKREFSATYYNLQAELLDKAGKPQEAEVARNSFKKEELEKAKSMNPMKELIIKKN